MKLTSTLQAHPLPLRVFQTRDQTKAFYNKISHVYDLLSERSEAPMRKAGLELLKPKPAESILEIGFGTGHMPRFARQGGGVEGSGVRTRSVRQDGEADERRTSPSPDCWSGPGFVAATRRSFLT